MILTFISCFLFAFFDKNYQNYLEAVFVIVIISYQLSLPADFFFKYDSHMKIKICLHIVQLQLGQFAAGAEEGKLMCNSVPFIFYFTAYQ